MDRKDFDALHAKCVSAFRSYVSEAEKTAAMLTDCTAEPMPFTARLKIALQEAAQTKAHSLYVAAKLVLHDAARLRYASAG